MNVRSLAAAAALGVTLAIAASGPPAQAAPYFQTAESVQIGYTDSAAPRQAFDWTEQQNLPLGSRLDSSGTRHTSRVYATYDLTAFRGTRFIDATLRVREIAAADCTKRAIEVWQTRAVSATPTWRNPPTELAKQDEILTPEFCPDALIAFDVTDAVRSALDRKQNTVTFELRVPAAQENDPSYGRELYWFSSVRLTVQFNHVPVIDNSTLTNAGRPCGKANKPTLAGGFADELQARATDGDENDKGKLSLHFAVWPIDNVGGVTDITVAGTAGFFTTGRVPAGVLVSGTTYAWNVQVTDGLDTSPWSKTCYFTYDGIRPPAPTVTSSNYPTTGVTPLGIPGRFTFSGQGDPDVAALQYGWGAIGVPGCQVLPGGQLSCADPLDGPNVLKPNHPGGTVTITLSPPNFGFNTLVVRSVDRAGNRSNDVSYQFFAPPADPTITVSPLNPQWNQPVTMTFAPHEGLTGVTSYTYAMDGSTTEQTIAAGPDGTAAVTFVASNPLGFGVTVRSRSQNGFVSQPATYQKSFFLGPGVVSDIYLDDGEPHGGVGVPGTFTFTPPPGWAEVKEYRYFLPDGTDFETVTAGPDGRATITFTPQTAGELLLMVDAIRPDGTPSFNDNFYFFFVG